MPVPDTYLQSDQICAHASHTLDHLVQTCPPVEYNVTDCV